MLRLSKPFQDKFPAVKGLFARSVHRHASAAARQRTRTAASSDRGPRSFAPRPFGLSGNAEENEGALSAPRHRKRPPLQGSPHNRRRSERFAAIPRQPVQEEAPQAPPRPSALDYRPPSADASRSDEDAMRDKSLRPKARWSPTKKVSLPTMAGIKALHAEDPVAYGPDQLSRQFGISYEAVKRILKSKYRDKQGGEGLLAGTKWDPSPMSNPEQSPVAAIRQAFAELRERDK